MALDFPNAPTVNQVFGNYKWDGEKWNAVIVVNQAYVDNADALRVLKAGDTMTGDLAINHAGTAGLSIVGANAPANGANIQLHKTGTNKWFIGHDSAIMGSGTSDNLLFYAAGTGPVLTANFTGGINVPGNIISNGGIVAGASGISAGAGGYSSTGPLSVAGTINAGNAANAGTYYFGNTGTKYLDWNGTTFSFGAGPLAVNGTLSCSGLMSVTSAGSPQLNLIGSGVTGGGVIYGGTHNQIRWGLLLGDGSAESGGNGGSNFGIYGYSDAGAQLGGYLTIIRATGIVSLPLGLTASGNNTIGPLGINPLPFGVACRFVCSGGSSQYGMSIGVAADNTNMVVFGNAAGSIVGTIAQTAASTVYNTSSSGELKEDLKSFDAGSIIDQTNVYDFKWKSTGERAYGVIAQQAVDVYPLAVTHSKHKDAEDEFWGVDYSKYVPVLLQELKALRARVAELENRTAIKPT